MSFLSLIEWLIREDCWSLFKAKKYVEKATRSATVVVYRRSERRPNVLFSTI